MKLFLSIAISYFFARMLMALPWQAQVIIIWGLFMVPILYLMEFLFSLNEHY